MTNDQVLNTSNAWDAGIETLNHTAIGAHVELYNRNIYHTALMTNSKAKFDSTSAWCRGIISLQVVYHTLQHHSSVPSVSWAILLRNMKLCRNLSACGLNNYLLSKRFKNTTSVYLLLSYSHSWINRTWIICTPQLKKTEGTLSARSWHSFPLALNIWVCVCVCLEACCGSRDQGSHAGTQSTLQYSPSIFERQREMDGS